jgi:hypothetical protein
MSKTKNKKKIIIKEDIDDIVIKTENINLNKENDFKENKKDNSELKNRGTGAGGKNTNSNGLAFEEETNFKKFLIEKGFQDYSKSSFKYFLIDNKYECSLIDGCKSPDECYIDETNKHIIIIEKKFQNRSGSVCEKIQTAPFKKKYFENLIPDYKITYAYVLSEWFMENCSDVVNFLKKEFNIPILIIKGKYIDEKFINELIK